MGPEGIPGMSPKGNGKGKASGPKGLGTVRTVLMLTTAGRTAAMAATKGLRTPCWGGATTTRGAAAQAGGWTRWEATVPPATPPTRATTTSSVMNHPSRRRIMVSPQSQMSAQREGEGDQGEHAHAGQDGEPQALASGGLGVDPPGDGPRISRFPQASRGHSPLTLPASRVKG